MNIGIFTDCYLPTKNGVSTVIAQVKQELGRRGHKVVVLTVAHPEDDPVRHWAGGFSRFSALHTRPVEASNPAVLMSDESVFRFPSIPFNSQIEVRLGLARQAAVNHILQREKLDIIHTHTEFGLGWAGKRAAGHAGLPWVHTLHTLYPSYRHYLPLGRLLSVRTINRILVQFLRGCDRVICPSEKGRAYVAACAPELPTVVIGNGVSQEWFRLDWVTQENRDRACAGLGIDSTDRVILYVGRLAQEKRVLALFDALRPLLCADAGCRALFVGAGPERDALADAARAAGLNQQMLLPGVVDWERMVEIYAISDAFVTASLSEIHPMTLIEAAMCGLPIVARRDISFSGLVLDGSTGFLVDSDREIAGKLAVILQNEMTRRDFAANAQALSAQFTVEAHVDWLEGLYQQFIRNRLREVSQ